MDENRRIMCVENKELATYLLQKKQEMSQSPKGLSENSEITLSNAYKNICDTKTAIKTLKDLSHIKGVGKWILKLMRGFFESSSGGSEPEASPVKGNQNKGKRCYVPQRNSAGYALLIALYRGTLNEKKFMGKQELIDAAEASGLSRIPIAPVKGKGKSGNYGSSSRDWYTPWSCMKTLITKGLVVRSSCPAKYMLTAQGCEVARDCLTRSGLADPIGGLTNEEVVSQQEAQLESVLDLTKPDSIRETAMPSIGLSTNKKVTDIPPATLERFTRMGYSKEQVVVAYNEVSATAKDEDASSLWLEVMCHLREAEIYNSHPEFHTSKKDSLGTSVPQRRISGEVDLARPKDNKLPSACNRRQTLNSCSASSTQNLSSLRACSSFGSSAQKSTVDGHVANMNILSMPPLSLGERFQDVYEVVLILDDREQFATQGSRSRRIIDNICSEFKIKIQIRRLPVGDAIWIARHKYLSTEYVLDFIVERKSVEDLRSSIRDNRYKDQKLRLLRSGVKKLIYIVEGDPNFSNAAESIKTACLTTEILEGFDVQRTSGLADTLRRYGFLTRGITEYYQLELPEDRSKCAGGVCPPYDEFIRKCQDMEKVTISDVFSIQLMQVPYVTEDIAVAVLDMYPTLFSLASAYARLDGDLGAQEEMLKKQSNNLVGGTASKNIFRLVWAT